MKAISLTIVRGGVAETFTSLHTDVRIVDFDHPLEDRETLPRNIGFEELTEQVGLVAGQDFDWE